MSVTDQYEGLLARLQAELVTLPDKPEETAEATLRSLWLTAAGRPTSADGAVSLALKPLTAERLGRLHELIDARLSGTPLAHLTGRQTFMGLELLAGPQALVPRKETELLGEIALAHLPGDQPATVLDVCTGSGNLAVAVAKLHPTATVHAADLSPEAVELARDNVGFVGVDDNVSVYAGDLFEALPAKLKGEADIVICNPPYISSTRVQLMDSEISAHEPRLAFDGGSFGVAIIGRLIGEAPQWLRPGGWLCFEIGLGQGPHWVKALSRRDEYDVVEPAANAEGAIRAIAVRRT